MQVLCHIANGMADQAAWLPQHHRILILLRHYAVLMWVWVIADLMISQKNEHPATHVIRSDAGISLRW
jgi:hypothetical protein